MYSEDPIYTSEQHAKLVTTLKQRALSLGEPVKPDRAVWERKLKAIEESVTESECWWIVDLKSIEVPWSCGIKNALGYSHKIEVFDTMNWVHGKYRDFFSENNLKVSQLIHETVKHQIEFMKQRYVVEVPVRHQNGHYLQATRTTYPFQFDAAHNLVSHIHHLFIHPNSKDQAFDMALFDKGWNRRGDLEQEVRKRMLEIAALPFSAKQMEIIAYYAYGKAERAEHVAALAKITLLTAYKHQTNIHKLAEASTGIKFASLKDIAEYYRSRGLI